MNESRICIALDFKTKSDVENFLKQFEGESLYVKVGMELFYGEGIEIIKMIKLILLFQQIVQDAVPGV